MFFMKFVEQNLFCNLGNFAICFIGLIIFLYFLQGLFDLATRGNGDRHKLLCKEVGRNGHNHDWTSELHSAPDHQTSNEGDINEGGNLAELCKNAQPLETCYMFGCVGDCPVQESWRQPL